MISTLPLIKSSLSKLPWDFKVLDSFTLVRLLQFDDSATMDHVVQTNALDHRFFWIILISVVWSFAEKLKGKMYR